jgi:hypothetical protein
MIPSGDITWPKNGTYQSRTRTCRTWRTTGGLVVIEARHEGVPHVLPNSLSILECRQ